jgi:hypothetical protein
MPQCRIDRGGEPHDPFADSMAFRIAQAQIMEGDPGSRL